jgi:arabinofuranan 3-O-arabinosyltransferase
VPALAGLSTGLPAPGAPFRLGCGQGPPVTVDGRTYPTSVSGTVNDLTSLTPLPLHLCTNGATLALAAGRHWLTSPGTGVPLAVTDLSLRASTASSAAPSNAAAAARQLRIGSWGAEYRTATIGPGSESYLEVHQVANPGWTATLNGHRLTPVTLDGWQQAYLVPAGAGGHVALTFTPATGYRWLLAGSAVAICVLIAAAAWPSRRCPHLRMRPAAAGPGGLARTGPGLGPVGYWLAVAAAAMVLALVGGPLVAAVPVVLMLGWWRPRWVPWLACAAMCAAGALAMTSLGHGPQAGAGAFGWPAQAAALITLAAALTPTGHRTRHGTTAAAPGTEGDDG